MIGQAVGSYRIVAKLGEGGMGAVYLGEHLHIARKAAIKVLLPQFSANQQIVARFFNEARATSLIRHPGIVDILDCSVLPDGNAYIVMEFLAGESLGSHMREHGRIAPGRALLLARHIADALAAAHDQNIVHRDLKPDNVFLVAGSDAAPIKILDFGIAKLAQPGGQEGSYKTRTGSIMGTPVYMSPEQCRGAGAIDHRTDIYSLGCILFEMLTGRPPFTYEGFGELIQAHLSTPPPRLRSLDPAMPAAVDALVDRLLAKSPDGRPPTMRGLVSELDAVSGAAPEAATPAERPVIKRAIARTAILTNDEPATFGKVRPQTTLGSASSEKMDVVDDDFAAIAPAKRNRGLVAAVAGLAVAAVAVVIWVNKPPPVAVAPRTQTQPTEPTDLTPPIKPPPADLTPPIKPPPTDLTPPIKPPPTDLTSPIKPPPTTDRPPAPRKIKVVITSEPSGADVCMAKDHVLLGKTKFEWAADKSSRAAKLLIRKRGYRGQEISVAADRDASKQVTLTKLGPDDLDDTDNCERR